MMQDPETELAKAYIDEYLRSKGYTFQSACQLPEEEAKKLWALVSLYVSNKLAEVSARSHMMHDIAGMGVSEGN